jgi:hypothetical protein
MQWLSYNDAVARLHFVSSEGPRKTPNTPQQQDTTNDNPFE